MVVRPSEYRSTGTPEANANTLAGNTDVYDGFLGVRSQWISQKSFVRHVWAAAQGREPSMALVGMLACRNGRRVAASRSERMGSDP